MPRLPALPLLLTVIAAGAPLLAAGGTGGTAAGVLPTPLSAYPNAEGAGLWEVLRARAAFDSFNLVALAIFVTAILHTFLAAKIRHWAHVVEERHAARRGSKEPATDVDGDGQPDEVSFAGQVLHFLGEVEVVCGFLVLALAGAITAFKGWPEVVAYVGGKVSYIEPLFVVVIMALAATRPVLD
ncbi:MAG: putative Na+/H+ antiporter, partial [Verrucomicrobiota bacterium]